MKSKITNSINIQYFKIKGYEFILGSYDHKLCMIDSRYRKKRTTIDNRLKNKLKAEFIEQEDDILKKTKLQLDEYFNNTRKIFNIPLLMVGSDFQLKVWKELQNIPYSTTTSYLQIAKNIGNEKAVRAVANANGANAIGIIVPCHRVIGTNGTLTGYAGGLNLKKELLDIEQDKSKVYKNN